MRVRGTAKWFTNTLVGGLVRLTIVPRASGTATRPRN
jgi:hypothetical protein